MNYKSLNVCFVGDSEVGKSTIINSSEITTEYIPTIENRSRKLIQINNKYFNFNIFDTAGSKELNYLNKNSIKQCDLFVIVCSLVNDKSIDNIQNHIDTIQECLNRKDNIPIIIVANKLDILKSMDNPIVKQQIKRINKKYKTNCMVTSSKNIDTINKLLKSLVKKFEKKKSNNKNFLSNLLLLF